MSHWSSQFRKGLLELCVLSLLRIRRGHGYQIVRRLREFEALEARESTVYPILSRLSKEALIRSRREASSEGPPRRVYELTEEGERRLEGLNQYWDELVTAVDTLRSGGGFCVAARPGADRRC